MLLEIPHFVIDALAHVYILGKHHVKQIEKKEEKAELSSILHKLAFFTTISRKTGTEEYWLLHQEVSDRIG